MAFTAAKAAHAAEIIQRAKAQMAKVRETTEEAIGDGLLAVEAGATAFGLGYANMRWGGEHGEMRVLGMPVDLGVATALGGLAAIGGFGKYREHGRNVGVGALALFAGRMGSEAGAKAAHNDSDDAYKKTLASGGRSAGSFGAGSGGAGSTNAGQDYVVAEKH